MTVTTPTTLEIVAQQTLASASLAKEPLHKILKRLNYLWRYHRPPLVAISPTVASMTRDTVVECGVEPSADGLSYEFTHRCRIGGANGTMAITVEQWDGSSWTTIAGPSSDATTANSWFAKTQTATIAANARRLRVTYAHGTDAYWVSDLHAIPAPTSTPATRQQSGWIGYDDGLLAATGAPIHAELLNRCKTSAIAVLQDRRSMVLSWAQDRTTARHLGKVTSPWGSAFTGSAAMLLGRGPLGLPGNGGKAVVSLHLHGKTTGGGATATCSVRQVGASHDGSTVAFDLDDAWKTGDLVVVGERPEVEVVVVNPDTSGTGAAILDSLVGFWTPGEQAP